MLQAVVGSLAVHTYTTCDILLCSFLRLAAWSVHGITRLLPSGACSACDHLVKPSSLLSGRRFIAHYTVWPIWKLIYLNLQSVYLYCFSGWFFSTAAENRHCKLRWEATLWSHVHSMQPAWERNKEGYHMLYTYALPVTLQQPAAQLDCMCIQLLVTSNWLWAKIKKCCICLYLSCALGLLSLSV